MQINDQNSFAFSLATKEIWGFYSGPIVKKRAREKGGRESLMINKTF